MEGWRNSSEKGRLKQKGGRSVWELLFLLQIAAVSERNLNLASAETGRQACKHLRHGKTNLALTATRSIQMQACVHSPVQEKARVHSPVQEKSRVHSPVQEKVRVHSPVQEKSRVHSPVLEHVKFP
jgi:hypothetical protein